MIDRARSIGPRDIRLLLINKTILLIKRLVKYDVSAHYSTEKKNSDREIGENDVVTITCLVLFIGHCQVLLIISRISFVCFG